MKTINIAGVERSNKLIHYGSTIYEPNKVGAIKNINSFVKPEGGLWTSPIDSKWGWCDWNDNEGFRECDIKNSFTVELSNNAKILVIDNEDDMYKMPKIEGFLGRFYPDFEKIADQYDAIWLTVNGQSKTRHGHPMNLYGWDCESVLVLNPDCIIQNINIF